MIGSGISSAERSESVKGRIERRRWSIRVSIDPVLRLFPGNCGRRALGELFGVDLVAHRQRPVI
jgi:hypothetical protein